LEGRRPPFLRRPDGELWTLEEFTAGAETTAVWNVVPSLQVGLKARWDSEYYDPVHLRIKAELEKLGCIELADIAKDIRCGPFGSAIHKDDYRDSGIPLIRVADTSGPFVKSDALAFIDEKLGHKLARHIVKPGDIVVSQRGTIAQFAMVTDEYEQWVASANLISILRSQKADFGYLLAFLNSRVGLSQVMRLQSGQVQPKIITDDVKSIRVYLPTPDVQRSIGDLTRESHRLLRRSSSLYAEAKALLLAELGLDDLDLSHQPTYTRNFSETWAAGRLDAEFYEPRYYTLLDRIRNSPYGAAPLLSKARYIRKYADIDPAKSYRYIELADINQSIGTVEKASEYRGDKLPSRARLLLKSGDVVISSVQGSLDKVALIPEHLDGALGSTGFFQFRPLEYPAEVLLVLLSSKPMQLQFHRHARGAILMATAASSLEDIFVPEVPDSLQEKITELIRKSHSSYDEAKRLLEEAKRRVEEMVLGEE